MQSIKKNTRSTNFSKNRKVIITGALSHRGNYCLELEKYLHKLKVNCCRDDGEKKPLKRFGIISIKNYYKKDT